MVRHFIKVHIVAMLAKTCTSRLLEKQVVVHGVWLSRWAAAITTKLSALARVHFGFSQGRLVPCNFYNARTIHCRELQLCNLLHHSIGRLRPGYGMPPTLYHPLMMLRSAIFMLCCASLATVYHPSNAMLRIDMLFHAICSTDNTWSSPKYSLGLFKLWRPFQTLISACTSFYNSAVSNFSILLIAFLALIFFWKC